jgi:hypothetical protein
VCRAADAPALPSDDEWGIRSATGSWEMTNLCDLERLGHQRRSTIEYARPAGQSLDNFTEAQIDLTSGISSRIVVRAERPEDSNLLRLTDHI